MPNLNSVVQITQRNTLWYKNIFTYKLSVNLEWLTNQPTSRDNTIFHPQTSTHPPQLRPPPYTHISYRNNYPFHPYYDSCIIPNTDTVKMMLMRIYMKNSNLNFIIKSKNIIIDHFIGTKSDLRMPNSKDFLTSREGKMLKKQTRAYAFVECSAKNMLNLQTVIDEAIRAIKRKSQYKKKFCRIL